MSDEPQDFEEIKNKIKWNDNGLVPAITQDVENGQVLMMAWMSEESLKLTIETRLCHYYSRSRRKLWKKGETSQSLQHVKWIKYDCDADTLLIGIHQDGNACHTGQRSCFHRDLETE